MEERTLRSTADIVLMLTIDSGDKDTVRIQGSIPFTLQETTRFKRQSMEERTLRSTADIMLMLTIENRRKQNATKSS